MRAIRRCTGIAALIAGFLLAALPAWAAADLEEGVKELAGKITKSLTEKSKNKIAIIDFSDLNGRVTALGQFMAEELTTQIVTLAPGKFEVVGRRQWLKLLQELTPSHTDFLEEKSLKEMGRVLGVEVIVTGSIADLGSTVKVNAQMIAVKSAKVFAVAATSLPKTGIVAGLVNKPAERTPASAKAPSAPDQQATPKADQSRIFENSFLRVTVRPVKKQGATASLEILYENRGGKPYLIAHSAASYLLDNNGHKWGFKSGTAAVGTWIELAPQAKFSHRITFEAAGPSEGQTFTFVGGLQFSRVFGEGGAWPPATQETVVIDNVHTE